MEFKSSSRAQRKVLFHCTTLSHTGGVHSEWGKCKDTEDPSLKQPYFPVLKNHFNRQLEPLLFLDTNTGSIDFQNFFTLFPEY